MRKIINGIILTIVLLCCCTSGSAYSNSNRSARKGLTVDAAGLFPYSTFTDNWGPKLNGNVNVSRTLSSSKYDSIYCLLKLKNNGNASKSVDLSLEIYYNDSYQTRVDWNTAIVYEKSWYEFWVPQFEKYDTVREGTYLYRFYVDGEWLIDREYYVFN